MTLSSVTVSSVLLLILRLTAGLELQLLGCQRKELERRRPVLELLLLPVRRDELRLFREGGLNLGLPAARASRCVR